MSGKPAIPPELETKVREALRSLSLRDCALVITAMHTGFRAQELAALNVGHAMDYDGVRSHITLERAHLKNGAGRRRRGVRSRTVPLTPDVTAALPEYLFSRFGAGPFNPRQPLFRSRKHGGRLGNCQMAHIVKKLMAAAGDERGWRYGMHSLQRFFCQKGVSYIWGRNQPHPCSHGAFFRGNELGLSSA